MNKSSMNMTEGSIIKNLVRFIIPVLIGNVFQQMYNVVDTAVVGNVLGDNALASIGAATPIYALLISLTEGVTNGFAVVIARCYGAGDKENLRKSVSLTYLFSAALALLLTVFSIAALSSLLEMLKTPVSIMEDASRYMQIILLFSVITVTYNMLAGMMRAVGNSRIPLYSLIVSSLLNVGLDILFVKGLSLGVAGAAYATVISQVVSVILCLLYCGKWSKELLFHIRDLSFDKPLMADLISTGFAMGLMEAIVYVGSVILQGAVNSFGTATIAAHTAARKISDIFKIPLGTVAMATSTFVSQNFGAGNLDRVRKGIAMACAFPLAGVLSRSSWCLCFTDR